jgi:hypothetical protein
MSIFTPFGELSRKLFFLGKTFNRFNLYQFAIVISFIQEKISHIDHTLKFKYLLLIRGFGSAPRLVISLLFLICIWHKKTTIRQVSKKVITIFRYFQGMFRPEHARILKRGWTFQTD